MRRIKRVSTLDLNSIDVATRDNLRQVSRFSSPVLATAANGVFTARHDLGSTPEFFIANAMGDIRVWATADNQRLWNDKLVSLTGSAAGRVVIVVGTTK